MDVCELVASSHLRSNHTHFDPRGWERKVICVRFIPALHTRSFRAPCVRNRVKHCSFLRIPVFFCLTELQFGEPFPALLHVFLGGFLRRGRLQCEIWVGITCTRGHFTLEPAEAWAVQEEDSGRIRPGPSGESRAPDRRWAAVSLLWSDAQTRKNNELICCNIYVIWGCMRALSLCWSSIAPV